MLISRACARGWRTVGKPTSAVEPPTGMGVSSFTREAHSSRPALPGLGRVTADDPIRRCRCSVLRVAGERAAPALPERPAEISEHPECNQIDTQQGLNARNRAGPPHRLEVIFTLGQQSQPPSEVDVAKADVKGRHQAEEESGAKDAPLPL